MPRGKDKYYFQARRVIRRYKPVENHSDPSTYPVIPLCPVATCGQPLVRRNGLIVCSADPWHYTQEVIQKWE